ncbi:hypothetical protein [Micromonospora sp. NPDC050200]|uniref:hypothetical protein n=1 Tax=Micromonospora sp. NPDC050200 TaxID=3155664 RepID=UPI0034103A68
MSQTIHLSAPDVGPLEESYLIAALRSGWVAPVGPDLQAVEREVAPTLTFVATADAVRYTDAPATGVRRLQVSLLTGAAERLFADGLTLPSGSALTGRQIDVVLGAIHDFLTPAGVGSPRGDPQRRPRRGGPWPVSAGCRPSALNSEG